MASDRDSRSAGEPPLGVYRRPEDTSPFGAAEAIGAGLSLLWLLGTGVFFAVVPTEGEFGALATVMTVLAVVLPLGMIWVAVGAARAARLMAEESKRLQGALDSMRRVYIAEHQGTPSPPGPTQADRKLDEVIAAQRRIEGHLAELRKAGSAAMTPAQSPPPAPQAPTAQAPVRQALGGQVSAPGATDAQASLALGHPAEAQHAPVSVDDFIRAIHFPQSETDRDGFRALKAALRNPATATLVRSSQDVLTLLSEDGIYMDDFSPDRARPEIWRRFAEGARGPAVTALGGIRDRSCLALTAGRMRNDAVFRDAAHHFLRKFDTTFSRFAETASDAEIAALSETRTARAFMLLGRVAGTFD
jgi:HAMP domain-containing protein